LFDENRSERAIIILDMINDIAHIEGQRYEAATADIIPFLQGELQYFRDRMRPVIFCNTSSYKPASRKNSFGREVIQALSPRTGEICLSKTRPNAFFETDLLMTLSHLKVKTLTIVGAFSHTSVITTAASALDFGFSVVVPETCVCASSPEDQATALRLLSCWLTA
jgi:nicotinamidase-related amidase